MVIGKALERCQQLELPVSAEMLAALIQALAETERIASQGDVRIWRFSEVRLTS